MRLSLIAPLLLAILLLQGTSRASSCGNDTIDVDLDSTMCINGSYQISVSGPDAQGATATLADTGVKITTATTRPTNSC